MDPILKAECPHCSRHVEYQADFAGQVTECPHCQQAFRLPRGQAPALRPRQRAKRNFPVGITVVVLVIAALCWLSVASGAMTFGQFWIVVFGITAYFLPSIIASRRKHHNATPIALLNFFLGWTFLGWLAALIWAFTSPPPK